MRNKDKSWDWDAVTDALCVHIAGGGTREEFAKKKNTPSFQEIFNHIGLDEAKAARVQAAYRFRSEGAADEVRAIRERLANEDIGTAEARTILSSLQTEINTMTSLTTRAPQAKAPEDPATRKGLAARIEEASERMHSAKDED